MTGTPTTNLLGLSFGQSSESPDDNDEFGLSEHESTPDTSDTEGSPSPQGRKPRVWTNDDRQDLVKLSSIISHSLSFPKFKADAKAFKNLVAAPLLGPTGPNPGGIQVLEQVMKAVMIRHR